MASRQPIHYNRVSEVAITILCGWAVFGVTLMIAGFFEWSPVGVLQPMPNWFDFLPGATIGGGSVLTLSGALPQHSWESDRWARESSGLFLTAVGWLVLTIAALVVSPSSALLWIFGVTFIGASLWRGIRVWSLSVYTRRIKSKIEAGEEV